MINKTFHLWKKEDYSYPVLGDFIPNIVTYLHDEDDKIRPAIIVVPGGAYCFVSPTEGEIVAKEFYNKGYNAFVVTYTINLMLTVPLKLQPLQDLARAVMLVRKNAEELHVDPDKIVICGFSAGGHLCGSLAVHHSMKELIFEKEYEGISCRPDAVILSYPVISSGEYGHKDSFYFLLGANATTLELDHMSLEKQVTKDTPPTFLWHTATDDLVPVQNSYLYANACKEKNVPFELHVFTDCPHGMSLANDIWASGCYGGHYTMAQFFEGIQYFIDNDMEIPSHIDYLGKITKEDSIQEIYRDFLQQSSSNLEPDKGIAIWPELAYNWLEKVLFKNER